MKPIEFRLTIEMKILNDFSSIVVRSDFFDAMQKMKDQLFFLANIPTTERIRMSFPSNRFHRLCYLCYWCYFNILSLAFFSVAKRSQVTTACIHDEVWQINSNYHRKAWRQATRSHSMCSWKLSIPRADTHKKKKVLVVVKCLKDFDLTSKTIAIAVSKETELMQR